MIRSQGTILLTRKFFLSWILSAVLMFSLSYVWHGWILNDLISLPYPLALFLGLSALVYLVIGFALTFVYSFVHLERNYTLKGLLLGGALGFFIYLIAFTLGVSFSSSGELEHVVVDFLWQMIEQGVGGTVTGLVFLISRRRAEMLGEE